MVENKIKLLVADDHRFFIEGLKFILKDELNTEVAGIALNGRDAIDKCNKEEFDVVLMDINMPVIDGISATLEIKRLHPNTKIIILSMLTDVATVSKALKAGINGYVLKTNSSEELITAFKFIAQNKIFISPSILIYFSDGAPDANVTNETLIKFSEELITTREKQVLKLIVEGFTDQRIAETLFLSDKTVSTHRKNMLAKLKLPNTAALVKFAVENKLT